MFDVDSDPEEESSRPSSVSRKANTEVFRTMKDDAESGSGRRLK